MPLTVGPVWSATMISQPRFCRCSNATPLSTCLCCRPRTICLPRGAKLPFRVILCRVLLGWFRFRLKDVTGRPWHNRFRCSGCKLRWTRLTPCLAMTGPRRKPSWIRSTQQSWRPSNWRVVLSAKTASYVWLKIPLERVQPLRMQQNTTGLRINFGHRPQIARLF